MKKITIIILMINLRCISCLAQKEDNNWILSSWGNDLFEITSLTFADSINFKLHSEAKIDISQSNSSISDSIGNLLFFSNGVHIFNRNYKYMEGGIFVNKDTIFQLNNANIEQNTVILPYPSSDHLYAFFYLGVTLTPTPAACAPNLSMAIVDMSKNNNLGKVLQTRKIIIPDTIETNKMTATRHANGRDWWVINQDFLGNKYFKVLLDPLGAHLHDVQQIGDDSSSSIGGAVFSPDGKYYINADIDSDSLSPNVMVFNFDRCSGQLSNPRSITYASHDYWAGGAAVSANSRYLYISVYTELYQYDLWADDLAGSEKLVGVYDGYLQDDRAPTRFHQAQLAPNGKIYISSSGACPYLHVINNPDLSGDSCNFVQRGQKLPKYNAWSVPNHPNYRLGALKGSPCDTLHSIAVKEKATSLQASLFPNPTSDQVTIKWQNDEGVACEVIIIDAVGRIVQRQESHASSLTLDTSSWANGLYYVQIVQEKEKRRAFLKCVKNN
ncbi:MAG: T9SS type A sorting domain-containing protein [Saprospiraceae bacterium]